MSHDHLKLQRLAFEIARAYGLQIPKGIKDKSKRSLNITFAEKAQAEATGMTPMERRRTITEIFNNSDTAEAFKSALEEQGYILAKGDRRAYVVIDRYAEVHSLSRQIEGKKTKDIKTRLSGLEKLPTAGQVREQIKNAEKKQAPAKLKELKEIQDKRRLKTIQELQNLELVHRSERLALHAAQRSEMASLFNRVASKVFALIYKIPALRSVIAHLHINPEIDPSVRHRLENDALERRHERERLDFQRKIEALELVEKREFQSLERKYRRMERVTERQEEEGTGEGLKMMKENVQDMTAQTIKAPTTEKHPSGGKSAMREATKQNLQAINGKYK